MEALSEETLPTKEDIKFARSTNGQVMVSKAWHFACMQENFLLNPDGARCSSPWSKYIWSVEKECLEGVPDEISYEELEASIPIRHRRRIRKAWRILKRKEIGLKRQLRILKKEWGDVPDVEDEKVDTILRTVSFKKHADTLGVLKGTIRKSPEEDTEDDSVLDWQLKEKNHRDGLGDADKNFLAAYRIYIDLLLEEPDPGGGNLHEPIISEEERTVLPVNHPARQMLAHRLVKLNVVDLNHQVLSMAKTYHYQDRLEKGNLLRKHSEEPYYMHPHRVALKMMYDILPFMIGDAGEEGQEDFIALVTLMGALHDLLEDADITVEGVMNFLDSRADKYDSSIEAAVESGFVTAEEYDSGEMQGKERMKNRDLNLVKSGIREKIRKVLLIVTKETEKTMSGELKQRAVSQNILGEERTRELIGTSEVEVDRVNPLFVSRPSRIVTRFPLSHSGKIDSFLLKMNAMLPGEKRDQQLALMVKVEDRSDNLATIKDVKKMDDKELGKHRDTLRETVTRLIAWCMLEHDRDAYPLYNTLPRLIEITAARYTEFMHDKPEMIETCDRDYFNQLKTWEAEVPYLPLPSSLLFSSLH